NRGKPLEQGVFRRPFMAGCLDAHRIVIGIDALVIQSERSGVEVLIEQNCCGAVDGLGRRSIHNPPAPVEYTGPIWPALKVHILLEGLVGVSEHYRELLWYGLVILQQDLLRQGALDIALEACAARWTQDCAGVSPLGVSDVIKKHAQYLAEGF